MTQPDLHRCANGKQCRDPETVDTPDGTIKLGAHIDAPTGLCEPCAHQVEQAVRDMPNMWASLHASIGDHTRRPQQRVKGTASRPINLNTDVDALKVAIVEWMQAAASRVADLLHVDPPEAANATDREHAHTVRRCTALLADHIDELLELPADYLMVWDTHTPYPGELKTTDRNGTHYGVTEQPFTGIDLANKLVSLRNQARKLLGITNPNDRLLTPCPYCSTYTLTRTIRNLISGKQIDYTTCTQCRRDWPYEQYEHLCHMAAEEEEMRSDELRKQLNEETRKRATAEWLLAERNWQFTCALQCDQIPASVFAQEVVFVGLSHNTDRLTDKELEPIIGATASTIRTWAARGHITRHINKDGGAVYEIGETWNWANRTQKEATA